jgi:hypothetical protein
MVKHWDDDLEVVGSQRGGTFSYLDQGADFVIDQRKADGLSQAKRMCGSRPIFFLGEQQVTSTSVGSMPITQTAYHQGTVGSGLDSTSYSGTTTYTTYAPTTYTWNRNRVSFICGDEDVDQESYQIRFGQDGAGVCQNMPQGIAPGRARLEKIASAATTEDCTQKEGWMRYLAGKENRKVHIFVGSDGKTLCQKLERENGRPTSHFRKWKHLAAKTSNLWPRRFGPLMSGASDEWVIAKTRIRKR